MKSPFNCVHSTLVSLELVENKEVDYVRSNLHSAIAFLSTTSSSIQPTAGQLQRIFHPREASATALSFLTSEGGFHFFWPSSDLALVFGMSTPIWDPIHISMFMPFQRITCALRACRTKGKCQRHMRRCVTQSMLRVQKYLSSRTLQRR